MKHKKSAAKSKSSSHHAKFHPEVRPLEFERAWQDLEEQSARMHVDWSSLAAQIGLEPRGRAF